VWSAGRPASGLELRLEASLLWETSTPVGTAIQSVYKYVMGLIEVGMFEGSVGDMSTKRCHQSNREFVRLLCLVE